MNFRSLIEKLNLSSLKEKLNLSSLKQRLNLSSLKEKLNLSSLIEKLKNLNNNVKIITIFSLVLVILLVVTIASWPSQQGRNGAGVSLDAEGELLEEGLAPDFTLTLLSGEDFTLSEHRGTVVVLSFWATWCGPCVEKLPYTQASSEHFGNRVVFVGINIGEDPDLVQDFIEEGGYTFFQGVDEDNSIFNSLYTSPGIPYSVIIGRDGVIVDEMVGWAYSMSNELNGIIEDALR